VSPIGAQGVDGVHHVLDLVAELGDRGAAQVPVVGGEQPEDDVIDLRCQVFHGLDQIDVAGGERRGHVGEVDFALPDADLVAHDEEAGFGLALGDRPGLPVVVDPHQFVLESACLALEGIQGDQEGGHLCGKSGPGGRGCRGRRGGGARFVLGRFQAVHEREGEHDHRHDDQREDPPAVFRICACHP